MATNAYKNLTLYINNIQNILGLIGENFGFQYITNMEIPSKLQFYI